jgi:hypothetical protein
MKDQWDELRELLPPPEHPYKASGDWSRIEADLGIGLPSDFKRFIAIYGSGSICDFLSLVNPFDLPEGQSVREAVELGLWGFRRLQKQYGKSFPLPLYPEPGGFLPFGGTENGNALGWRCHGHPDTWDVVATDTHYEEFLILEGVRFLAFLIDVLNHRSAVFPSLFSDRSFRPPLRFTSASGARVNSEDRTLEVVNQFDGNTAYLIDKAVLIQVPTDWQVSVGTKGTQFVLEISTPGAVSNGLMDSEAAMLSLYCEQVALQTSVQVVADNFKAALEQPADEGSEEPPPQRTRVLSGGRLAGEKTEVPWITTSTDDSIVEVHFFWVFRDTSYRLLCMGLAKGFEKWKARFEDLARSVQIVGECDCG